MIANQPEKTLRGGGASREFEPMASLSNEDP